MISLFVASKNRASQLRLLLESLNRNCSDLFDLNILYNFDDDSYKEGYKKLQEENIVKANWEVEDSDSNGVFVRQFYDFLNHAGPHFALMVDDNVFYRENGLNQDRIEEILDEETFSFSFRLGVNTIIQDHILLEKQDPLEDQDIKEDHAKWKYTDRAGKFQDYAFPFSWDGVIYRTKDVLDTLQNTDFSTTDHTWAPLPHRLEEHMSKNLDRYSHRQYMAAPKYSCVVGMDYNKVINVQNRGGSKFRADERGLNDLYLKDFVIDFDSMDFSSVQSAHDEVPFKLRKL